MMALLGIHKYGVSQIAADRSPAFLNPDLESLGQVGGAEITAWAGVAMVSV